MNLTEDINNEIRSKAIEVYKNHHDVKPGQVDDIIMKKRNFDINSLRLKESVSNIIQSKKSVSQKTNESHREPINKVDETH